MVSMKDIAVMCGVSIATVSKALNGQSDISEDTRRKITQTADELGYLTNSAARALKTNRTYNIGVLFVDEGSRGLTHEFFAAVLNSFKSEAESRGYDITFINNHNIGSRKSTYLQHCRYRGVDGVLIACVDFNDPQVLELISSEIPVVTIDHVFQNKTSVLSDNAEGIESLVRYAFSKGHRTFAYIHGEENVEVTSRRIYGFKKALSDLNIDFSSCNLVSSYYYHPDECYKTAKKLLNSGQRPSCIMFPDDFAMMGGLRAIAEAGLSIPDDISVMGYDGIVLSEVISPKATTYKQDTNAIGSTAAIELIKIIESADTAEIGSVTVKGTLVTGESVGDYSV